MILSTEFKQKVREALLQSRQNYGGSDADFAKKMGMNNAIYSRIKNGETERVLSDAVWLSIARELNVSMRENKWKVARTKVYSEIEGSLHFCQSFSKSMILVDDCGIGKTFSTKHILRGMKNAFYVDCSQAKTKQQFIRLLARTLGVDNGGRYIDVKNNLKYYISMLEHPLVVLDEAGDLEYTAFLELKEMWNATNGFCGWYMLGADGLRAKIERGIRGKKVGYAEIFSRFSDEFVRLVPVGSDDRKQFYTQLISDVAKANTPNEKTVPAIVKQCLSKGGTLRYLETLINISA